MSYRNRINQSFAWRIHGLEALETRHCLDAAIEGFVWNDWNQDGHREKKDTEHRVADVEVRLLTANHEFVRETTTDEAGVYDFSGLDPGDYVIEFIAPEDTEFTKPDQSAENKDSDANLSTGVTEPFRLNEGQKIDDIDAGLFSARGTPSIQGRVWHDLNGDGLQSAGEPGLPLVEVQLENQFRTKLIEVTTDSEGRYQFDGSRLLSGDYFVDVKNPGGVQDWLVSPFQANEGAVPWLDSDVRVDGRSPSFSLAPADARIADPRVIDAGFHASAELSGTVWHDANRDGWIDLSEPPVADTVINLLDLDNEVVATTRSTFEGTYQFNVQPGRYRVEVVPIEGTGFTTQDHDSEIDPLTGLSELFIIGNETTRISINAGLFALFGTDEVVGRVWHDLNANGLQDPGEPGLSSVRVELENLYFRELAQVRTDQDGYYRFDALSLLPGAYHLDFIQQADDWRISPRNAFDTNRDDDSDAHSLNGKSPPFVLKPIASTNDRTTVQRDAGFFTTGSISGGVWDDLDEDGLRSASEQLVGRVEVQLLDEQHSHVATTQTNSAGRFRFEDLVPGKAYTLQITPPDGTGPTQQLAAESTLTSAIAPATGRSELIVLGSGERVLRWVGIHGLGTTTEVSGHVWDDLNGDGLQSATEVGIEGVRVQAYGSEYQLVATTATDEEGRYAFPSPENGIYRLEFLAPHGATFSPPYQGGDRHRDSDVNRSTGRTAAFPVIDGQSEQSIDAGIYRGTFSSDVQAQLRVTEVGFIGHGAVEFVEVRNIGSQPLDLTGVRITEGVRFDFGKSAVNSLFPNELAVVVGKGTSLESVAPTDRINVAGTYEGDLDRKERLTIEDERQEVVTSFVYDHEWFVIMDDEWQPWTLNIIDPTQSESTWSQKQSWRPSSYLTGTPGFEDPRLTPDTGAVVINEVLTSSDDGFNDWIELRNTTNESVDISYWYLGDQTQNQDPEIHLTRYRIPAGTVLPPNGYVVFSRDEHFANVLDPGLTSLFGLSSFGESVHLVAADRYGTMLGYSDSATFLGAETEKSYGRVKLADGTTTFAFLTEPTRGRPNAAPAVGDVVIDQIMYASPGVDEYIRLHNKSSDDVVFSERDWRIQGGIRYQFLPHERIPGNGYALIVSTPPEQFRREHQVPSSIPIFGPFSGNLNNAGEQVTLVGLSGIGRHIPIDTVRYANDWPWPEEATNGRAALLRASLDRSGEDATSWTTTLGTDRELNQRGIFVDQAFESNSLNRFDHNPLGLRAYQAKPGDANGDGRFDSSDLVQVFERGQYQLDSDEALADWLAGDWNFDGRFDPQDFVLAFRESFYRA